MEAYKYYINDYTNIYYCLMVDMEVKYTLVKNAKYPSLTILAKDEMGEMNKTFIPLKNNK